VERIFSIINDLWTDEKKQFKVETIKAIIVEKHTFKKFPILISTTYFNRTLNYLQIFSPQTNTSLAHQTPVKSHKKTQSHSLAVHPLYKTGILCVCVLG
jgi:hypothetical protein